MALLVEDGTIVEGANSYVDETFADEYHTDRLNQAWLDATSPAKSAALIRATQFIDNKYFEMWKGRLRSPYQPLNWPRNSVTRDNHPVVSGHSAFYDYTCDNRFGFGILPNNQIPAQLKYAVCEAALRALSGSLAPDTVQGIKKEVTDVLETEYSGTPVTVFYEIENLLKPLLLPKNSMEIFRS